MRHPSRAGRELQLSEGIDRGGVRIDERADVADHELAIALLEQRAKVLAQRANVAGPDAAGDGGTRSCSAFGADI